MCSGFSRQVNININGNGCFMPFYPIGGFPYMYGGWGMCSPADFFGFSVGNALGNLAFRGVASLFNRLA